MNGIELKAWIALSENKLMTFGYFAGNWVSLNNKLKNKKSSHPWSELVNMAKKHLAMLSEDAKRGGGRWVN